MSRRPGYVSGALRIGCISAISVGAGARGRPACRARLPNAIYTRRYSASRSAPLPRAPARTGSHSLTPMSYSRAGRTVRIRAGPTARGPGRQPSPNWRSGAPGRLPGTRPCRRATREHRPGAREHRPGRREHGPATRKRRPGTAGDGPARQHGRHRRPRDCGPKRRRPPRRTPDPGVRGRRRPEGTGPEGAGARRRRTGPHRRSLNPSRLTSTLRLLRNRDKYPQAGLMHHFPSRAHY
jgi:hypothetical protein